MIFSSLLRCSQVCWFFLWFWGFFKRISQLFRFFFVMWNDCKISQYHYWCCWYDYFIENLILTFSLSIHWDTYICLFLGGWGSGSRHWSSHWILYSLDFSFLSMWLAWAKWLAWWYFLHYSVNVLLHNRI